MSATKGHEVLKWYRPSRAGRLLRDKPDNQGAHQQQRNQRYAATQGTQRVEHGALRRAALPPVEGTQYGCQQCEVQGKRQRVYRYVAGQQLNDEGHREAGGEP